MMDWEESTGTLAFHAENGDHSAQYRLGLLFLLGRSVEQDLEAALRWLKLAGDYGGAHLLVARLTPYKAANQPQKRALRRAALSGLSLSGLPRSMVFRAVTLRRVLRDQPNALLQAWRRLYSRGRVVKVRLGAGTDAGAMDGNRGPNGLSETT